MMRTCCPAMLAMIVGFAVFVDCIQVAHAVVDDQKCLTMIAPKQCKDGGSTFCMNYGAANPGKCNGTVACFYCDSTTALPDDRCVYYEGAKCTDTGMAVKCPASHQYKGFCATRKINGFDVCVCIGVKVNDDCVATDVPTCTK